jgi:DNA-directed RNA polymerase beta subunit
MLRYDIEDAIVMNKYSMDRGFGRCIVTKKYGVSLRKYGNRTSDRIVAPNPAPGEGLGLPWCLCGHTSHLQNTPTHAS